MTTGISTASIGAIANTPGECITIDTWLENNTDEICQAQAFGLTALPDDPTLMGSDLSRSNSEHARMSYLLVDAESFLLVGEALAHAWVRTNMPELTAAEKKVEARSRIEYVQAFRLCGTLRAVVQSLKDKSFALMNLRRTTYTPNISHE